MFSSVISSGVFTMRVSCISAWPSTTVIPAASSARRTGSSTMSTPSGSPSRPRCSSSARIFSATASARPGNRPAQGRDAGARAVFAEPRVEELVMPGGRAEVPHDRLVALRQQAEADVLVDGPHADVGGRDVADVAHVEAEQRAQLRLFERCLRASQACLAQPVEVDPLLPVDPHHAIAADPHRAPPVRCFGRARARLRPRSGVSARSRPRAAARTAPARPSRQPAHRRVEVVEGAARRSPRRARR